MTNENIFEIRTFGRERAPEMTAISADVGWNQPEEEIEEIIERSGKYLLGAFHGDTLVGTAASYPYPDGNFAYVNEVIVLSAWRKRGAATLLLEKLLPLTLADYPVLRLCATALGRPIYEKFGFRPFATVSFGEFAGGAADAAGISPLEKADLADMRWDTNIIKPFWQKHKRYHIWTLRSWSTAFSVAPFFRIPIIFTIAAVKNHHFIF